MCTCKVGSSYNSTKIVRILYLIKNEYKWIFSLFLSCCKYILNLCIFISCANGNNSLMMSCSCKSVESFLINIIDNCICFLCFSDNTLYWSILTAVKNKKLINSSLIFIIMRICSDKYRKKRNYMMFFYVLYLILQVD